MKVTRRRFDEVSFQLAPMIDMTFLLLIFFMVTTRISKEQKKVDIRLPIASNAQIPPDQNDRDTISIDAEGTFFIGNNPATAAELKAYIKQRFIDYPPLRLYVRADATTPALKIKEVMRIAAEAGALNVIFGSYQKP
jgi:biopolymer transport protein ExbD